VELAIHNPTPLLVQDSLKLASAVVAVVMILVLFHRLQSSAPGVMKVGALFGLLSVVCLVANAGLSLFAVWNVESIAQAQLQIGKQINTLISLLGLAAIVFNGFWYLASSWVALRSNRLPRGPSLLGLLMGGLSLVPPLAILVLILSIPWSLLLGQALLSNHWPRSTASNKPVTES